MRQCFLLDRRVLGVYVGVITAACRSAPGLVLPAAAQPVSQELVAEWIGNTIPLHSHLHRFKWLFVDERASAGGRGSARVAPPDSLRFDASGPFGSGAGSAVVVGQRAVWTDPPDAISKLVPNYPLMWAMFGVATQPQKGSVIRGLSQEDVTTWEYAGLNDTV